jgi:hypothetical protein
MGQIRELNDSQLKKSTFLLFVYIWLVDLLRQELAHPT